jgi:cell wall-associated NlpC family hydrolase
MPFTRGSLPRIAATAGIAVVAVGVIGGAVANSLTAQPLVGVPSSAVPAPVLAEAEEFPEPMPSPASTPTPTVAAPSSAAPKASTTPAAVKSTTNKATTAKMTTAKTTTAAEPAKGAMRYTSTITPVQGGVTIKAGWNGTRVYLIRKHFGTDAPTSKGGTYDSATQAKVKEFQQQHGLPATGNVDQATWDALDTGYPFDIDAFQEKPRLSTSAGASERTNTMIQYALDQRGSRYAWGGAGPYKLGYDCSGLVLQAIYAAGYDPQPINVVKHAEPTYRTSGQLYANKSFQSIPINDRQRGDLIFFGNKAGVVHHVAIYLGDGTMMESYGATAGIRAYSPQYGSSYVLPYAKRVVR